MEDQRPLQEMLSGWSSERTIRKRIPSSKVVQQGVPRREAQFPWMITRSISLRSILAPNL